jgi:hypothetical protein
MLINNKNARKRKLPGLALLAVSRCSICGAIFANTKELEEHGIAVHNFAEQESSLLRKAGLEEKARRRSRGPYRKAHAA